MLRIVIVVKIRFETSNRQSKGKHYALGGHNVVLPFNETSPVSKDGQVDFQLNTEKSAQFVVYKNKLKN